MHGRLCKFLNKINHLYAKPFGFWNTHSTKHALISITKEIRRALDKDEFACGVFLDFQKAVDTVNHKMLPTKLEYHGIRTLESDYFKSHMANRLQQKYSRNNISPTRNNLWSTTSSVLGPLLFSIYVNDLNEAIEHSIIHHSAVDTNILYSNKWLKKSTST